MVRISRIVVSGYPHHVTQRGVRSMSIFRGDEDHRKYLPFMAEETERFGVEILSWCLMTNHVHFIAVPQQEKSLARAFGEVHRRYTRIKNFAGGWQRVSLSRAIRVVRFGREASCCRCPLCQVGSSAGNAG